MMSGFDATMQKIMVNGVHPKLLQRMSKRKEVRSAHPPHMRVELQSLGHKVQIFYQVRAFRAHNNHTPSFSVASDIPRYALGRHNALQKIAVICRKRHSDLYTRVCIRNTKWPELQVRDAAGTWGPIPNTFLTRLRRSTAGKQKRRQKERRLRSREKRQHVKCQ